MYNVTGLTQNYALKNPRQLLIPSDKLVIIENKFYFKFQGKTSLILMHLTYNSINCLIFNAGSKQ